MNKMSIFWICWLFSLHSFTPPLLVRSFEQRSDCVDFCAHLETSQEFGDCLSQCSRRPRKDTLGDVNGFASPPFNVRVETRVVMDEGKILETTINWNADDSDLLRTGFYIRYTALNSTCQKNFHGFFTSSISASERSLTIPAAFNGHPLIIDHSCTFQLIMKSIPYPAADEKYVVETKHTVPECIDKYCSCKANDVAEIKNLKVSETTGGYELSWNFAENSNRDYSFYVDIFEKIQMPTFKNSENDDDGFTFRIANQEPFEVLAKSVRTSPNTFKFPMPFAFESHQQYRISIFATEDRFCHNSDAFHVFNTTNSSQVLELGSQDEISTTLAPPKEVSVKQPEKELISKTVILESTAFLLICLAVACMSPLCTVMILFLLKRRNKDKKQQSRFLHRASLSCSRHSIMETNILYRPPQEVGSVTEWQIRGQDIVVGTVIGEGAFGLVFKGILRGPNGQVVRVAVKQLKANAVDEEREEFVREIQMMQTVGVTSLLEKVGQHDNIVTMYGYCMDENLQCMIMEFVPFGDLKHYLQDLRKQLAFSASTTSEITKTPEPEIDYIELLSFSQQIAQGMSHLEALGIIHRDLAARNILVGNGKVLKISDFGMSRPGVYIKMSKGVIPLRWLSPEAIKDNMYSAKSDVWAYGVLLWEMTTLGGFPYEKIADKDIHSSLMEGHRLEKPIKCSDEIYNLMKSCWAIEARDRPTFHMIFQILSQLGNQPTINIEKQAGQDGELGGKVFNVNNLPNSLLEHQPSALLPPSTGGVLISSGLQTKTKEKTLKKFKTS